MFDVIPFALQYLLTPNGALFFVLGVIIGLTIGVVPGIGASATIAMLLPLTFRWNPMDAFVFFTAIFGSTTVGGSITAILLNVPGTPENIMTTIDGYPMARKGRAAEAIATAAFASLCGGLVSWIVFFTSLPLLRMMSSLFGPAEVFWLVFFAIIIISAVSRGSFLGNMALSGFAFILSFHGMSSVTGVPRFTHGILYLYDGFDLTSAILGTYAVSEMIKLFIERKPISYEEVKIAGSRKQGILNVFKNKGIFFRSVVIGYIVGVIPGIGGMVAQAVSYAQTVQLAKDRENFGKGDPRGIVAPESANNAKDVGQLVPTVSLGIPGSATMAILLAAMLIHGLQPGPFFMRDNPEIVALITVTLLLAFLASCNIALFAGSYLARITKIQPYWIFPTVITICLVAVYYVKYEILDAFTVLFFGILGYIVGKLGLSKILIVMPLILGPLAEYNLSLALSISRGDIIYFFSPVSIILIISMILTIVYPFIKGRR